MRLAVPAAAVAPGLLPALAMAQGAAPIPAGGAAVVQLALSLAVVVGLIFAFAWLARRLRVAPLGAAGAIRVLAQVPVGPRERVVLLAVGDRQALVGVSGSGITALTLLEGEVTLAGSGPGAAAGDVPLAERMRAMLEKRGRP
ncbi:MAG: flagellar biosynthetic protein FliO [Steroidobacteraceae bacterium]|jgi:flagellar protein FliO/FliZ|nr:flagellar biosynthetic protein FliO [Steroidobacteraceae bacterium]